MVSIDEMATFCKRRGFVFPNSEIYGGLAGFYDYGPLGVELKNNLKNEWWKNHVQERSDVVGIDGSIISHHKVWEASGHVSNFDDIMVECSKCSARHRGDHLIEELLKINAEGLSKEDVNKLIKENNVKCPDCNGKLREAKPFNLMFKTTIGPVAEDSSIAYLRPETAQHIFTNFKNILETSRVKLPFGVAQIGRAFRNEISPRGFLFRCREFEMMEIEYFVNPKDADNCPYIKEVENHEVFVYSAEMQKKKGKEEKMKIKDALKKGIIKTQWHAYWLAKEHLWFIGLGADKNNFRIRQHLEKEKSHYAQDTWDLEYKFPFGWKELQGISNRVDFDLKQHIKFSGKKLEVFDEETKKGVVPYVIAEPSLGVDRTFLVFLFDAYTYDQKRENIVLKLHPKLAPVKLGIFSLVNKLDEEAKKVFEDLKSEFNCFYDSKGSIGRRYARQDEIGTPYCITLDFDSLKKGDVTLRDRDTTNQIRVKRNKLKEIIGKLLNNQIKFEDAGISFL